MSSLVGLYCMYGWLPAQGKGEFNGSKERAEEDNEPDEADWYDGVNNKYSIWLDGIRVTDGDTADYILLSSSNKVYIGYGFERAHSKMLQCSYKSQGSEIWLYTKNSRSRIIYITSPSMSNIGICVDSN